MRVLIILTMVFNAGLVDIVKIRKKVLVEENSFTIVRKGENCIRGNGKVKCTKDTVRHHSLTSRAHNLLVFRELWRLVSCKGYMLYITISILSFDILKILTDIIYLELFSFF